MAEAQALIGAIDQGTSSTRVIVFNASTWQVVALAQQECEQLYPHEGWVDMRAEQLLSSTQHCIQQVASQLQQAGHSLGSIKAVGITNQRETCVVWDKQTGEPLCNAIVWLDARTTQLADDFIQKTPNKSADAFRDVAGLPIHPYFSALKLRWMLENVDAVKQAVEEGRALAGTVDSWLIWKLTGGRAFVTDVSNASRYLLMDIKSRRWSAELCEFFGVPQSLLPDIRSSAEEYGVFESGPFKGIPIAGCLGDQQAALVGHGCFEPGQAKCTYGTGCFLLSNSGPQPVISQHGLLTTVAYQFGPDAPCYYALEGAGSMGGSAVQWLRDKLGIIKSSSDVEALAASVSSCGSCVFVPCFSGLFAPHWKPNARAVITGISAAAGATSAAHIARAALQAVCCQTSDMLQAINSDSGQPLKALRVDGGMTVNGVLMQLQADVLGASVQRVHMPEVTALGAATAAAIATGVCTMEQARARTPSAQVFQPNISEQQRESIMQNWTNAVQKAIQ